MPLAATVTLLSTGFSPERRSRGAPPCASKFEKLRNCWKYWKPRAQVAFRLRITARLPQRHYFFATTFHRFAC